MAFKLGDYVRGIDSLTNICYTGRIIDIEYTLTDWASYCIDTVWGNKWLINDTIKKVEGENEMTFKVGDKVYGKNRHNDDWVTGEIIHVSNQSGYLIEPLNVEYSYAWLETDTVKLLLEETPDQKATKEEPTKYTQKEINQQIMEAYHQFDNDSQRLSYLQGYFTK